MGEGRLGVGEEQERKILELDFGHVKFEVSRHPHGTVEWSLEFKGVVLR